MEEVKSSYYKIEDTRKAYFVILGTGLMSIFTLGLLFPLANYLFNRYFITRKYIDNRQLAYKAKLWLLFIIFYIGVALLFLCIYLIQVILNHYNLSESIPHQLLNAIPGVLGSIFIQVQINKYNQMSTHFVDEEGKKSEFKFRLLYFLGKYALTKIIKVVSLALLYPISTRLSTLYDYKRGYIDGYRFSYRFSMKNMYPRYLLDLLLCIITLALYVPKAYLRRMIVDQEYVHIKK